MITVETALSHLFDLVSPLGTQTVPLTQSNNRVLAKDVVAKRDQPPFSASAMDGYAVPDTEIAAGQTFTVIGEAAAGHRFKGTLAAGQAVRIFTGAPLPAGATRIVIQEDVTRSGDTITLNDNLDAGFHIRPSGGDFKRGASVTAPRVITSSDVALFASMNAPEITVTRKPTIAILATGDELVVPGETPNPDQIIASNSFGLKAMFENHGADVRLLPIAKDTESSLAAALYLAQGADLIITIGGASVGDHDLVGKVAADKGLDRAFYKVRMRPGKPLMAGRFGESVLIGLPGNPVSAMVCGTVFVVPVIRKMLGLGQTAAPRKKAPLASPIPANGPREHYMRGVLDNTGITVFDRQDSSLLSVLSAANVLVVRPIDDPAQPVGAEVAYIEI